MGSRRVEGVEPAPQKPSSRRVASRAWRPAPTPSSRRFAGEGKTRVQKDRCLKTGGGGRGSQENLCKMLSARAAVARAARGRLWNHGRRQLDGQLRAAGEALRFAFLRTVRHEQSRLDFQRLRQQRRVLESLDHGLLALDARVGDGADLATSKTRPPSGHVAGVRALLWKSPGARSPNSAKSHLETSKPSRDITRGLAI